MAFDLSSAEEIIYCLCSRYLAGRGSGRLVAGLSRQKPRFDPRLRLVRVSVKKVAVGQDFSV